MLQSIIRLCGVVTVVLVVYATLLLPSKLEQLRTGHWALEHFLGYFAVASIVCLGWPRPLVVAGLFIPFAAVLEGLQAFTPDHTPAVLSAVSGAGGVLAAALLAKIVIERQRRLRLAAGQYPEDRGAADRHLAGDIAGELSSPLEVARQAISPFL